MTSSIFPLLTHEQHLMLIEDLARFERECKAEGARRASIPAEPRVPGAAPETVYISLPPPMAISPWSTPATSPPGPSRASSTFSSSSSSSSASSSSNSSSTTNASQKEELTPEQRRERNLALFHELEKDLMRKQAKRQHAFAVKRSRITRPGSATHDHSHLHGRRMSHSQSTLPIKQWY